MRRRLDPWLTALVLGHFIVSLAHGAVHAEAGVALDPGSALFVLVVIGIGPVAGLTWSSTRPRAGALVVAATMAGAFVFGVVKHFVVASPDHVAQVDARWQPLFGSTAALLALLEAAGAIAGLGGARRKMERST